jgi:hypothetical protein
MRERARFVAALGGLALAVLASAAAANGRFPRAQRLIQDQESPELMALYGTYGLLVTRDAGASWRHVCEGATGTYAGEDSLLEIMAEERIVLRTETGLSRSDASLCSYTTVLGSTADVLQDITRDSQSRNGLLSLTTALGAGGVFVSSLSASTDGGLTFTPLASVAPDVLELGLTLDVAANQPELIYVSGLDSLGQGKLARSDDRGQSFVGFQITGLGISAPPYIAAISANNPDMVFVRTDEYSRAGFEGRETADDSLYFTPDGGQTWHLSLNKRGKLYGFALSPDEQWVLAGFGDPVLPAIFVEPDEIGLYRVALEDLVASPDAPPWERIYDRGVTCLRWTEDALFACVVQDESGFEVGRAPDASFSLGDAAPFESLLRLPEVRPLECPAESAGAACLTEEVTGWQATCSVLRAQCSLDGSQGGSSGTGQTGPGGASTGGTTNGSAAAPPASSSGMGGASSSPSESAGAAGASSSSEGSGQPGDAEPARAASGSCSAVVATGTAAGHISVWTPFALLLLAARRRVQRRGSGASPALLLVFCASSLSACSEGSPSGEDSSGAGDVADPGAVPSATSGDCAGAGEDFMLGMSKTTPSGAVTVAIVAAEPAPPLKGTNSWTVQLSGASSEPITGASVSFSGRMPLHRHGLTALPLTRELDGGRYEIQPIILFMPQLWELSVVVTRNDDTEAVTFDVCVP